MKLYVLLCTVLTTPPFLAAAAGPSPEETATWQGMELVAFRDFDDLEVVLTDHDELEAGRRGAKHKAFLVGLRPISDAVKDKDRQDRVRKEVADKMRKSTLWARVVTRRGNAVGLSVDTFGHHKNDFGHEWNPAKYPYCWSGWGAYNFNAYFLSTGVTKPADNFGRNDRFRDEFTKVVKIIRAKQKEAEADQEAQPYPAELQQKLDRAERPTVTNSEFRDYLGKRFQVNLPAGAKVENFFAQVGFRTADWDTVIREYYAKIALTPEHLTVFCKAWRDGPKPKGQSRIYEEDESLPTIAGLPAPAQTPVQVKAWMKAESPWVFCYLDEGRTGGVIMRVSKKTNHIHLWAYELAKEKQAEANYFKVKIRGTLRVKNEPPKTGAPELDKQPFSAAVQGNRVTPHLFFGGDEKLLAAARKLDGKTVVLSGEMSRFIGGTISGLDERPALLVDCVKVTTLQAVEAPGKRGDLGKFQGTWLVMDMEYEGKKESKDIVKALQVVIKDDIFALEWMGLPNQIRFKVNPAPTPKVIDLIDPKDATPITEWGIYEWQWDDQLKLCVRAWRPAPAPSERPKDFDTKKPGSALTLMVLKRKAAEGDKEADKPKSAKVHGIPKVAAPAQPKEALVGKWVSDDADRIQVEFGADGSFKLAVSKSIGSTYPAGWKWETAEGTYKVADGGRVEYTAKLGRLTVRGHFTMKDGALVHPTGANYQSRWKKLTAKSSDPPVAPQRDPEDAFAKACALVAALEGKHDLLKGVSTIKPTMQRDKNNRLTAGALVFANNAAPPGKNDATAKDDSKPFFYVSVQLWSGRTQSPPANLYEFEWQGQTYQMWLRVHGSDAELVNTVRKSVNERLREPPPVGGSSSEKWPGARSSLQALAPETTTVVVAVARDKAEIHSRRAAHLSTQMTLGKGEVIEGGGYVFYAECRQKFQVVEILRGQGKTGDRVLEYSFLEKKEGFPLPPVQEPFPADVKLILLIGEKGSVLKALPDTQENRKTVLTVLSEQKGKEVPAPAHKPSDVLLIANWVYGNDPDKAFAKPFGDNRFLTDAKEPLLYTDISEVKAPVGLRAVDYEVIQARMRQIKSGHKASPAVLIVRSSLDEPAEAKVVGLKGEPAGRVYYVEVAIGNLAWHWLKVVIRDDGEKSKANILWYKSS